MLQLSACQLVRSAVGGHCLYLSTVDESRLEIRNLTFPCWRLDVPRYARSELNPGIAIHVSLLHSTPLVRVCCDPSLELLWTALTVL